MKEIFSIMPDFLRNPDKFFKRIGQGVNLNHTAITLSLVSLFSFMIYGSMLGLAKMPLQALSSAVKIPLLFLSSMAFCLPALYFFSLALLGTPMRFVQVLTVVLSGISVTAFLLLGLAPITLFFVLTSTNYEFFLLLAVAFVGVSACIGVYFLWRGMTLVDTTRDAALKVFGKWILFLWILLYGFVGTQMAWRLSPFIGRPGDPFYLMKPSRDNFYIDVTHAIGGVLNLPPEQMAWTSPLILGGLCLLVLGIFFFAGGAIIGNLIPKRVDTSQKQDKVLP